MLNFSFWQKWLFTVSMLLVVFGILMALLSATPLFDLFNRQIDPAFWGSGVVDASARGFQSWIYGVWGATITGWGIFLSFIVAYPFQKREKWAWNCLVVGLLVWYGLDTGLSFIHGVYFNAVFNTGLLLLAMAPAIMTRKDF
jgi:hypothetical protein